MNLNLSASLNATRLLFKPSICLPHHTVSTFNDLPIPLDSVLHARGLKANIRAVVLDKDDCFAYPDAKEDHFEKLRQAYPGRKLLVVSNTSGATTWDKNLLQAVEKPGCGPEIMAYFEKHPETGVTDPSQVAVVGDRLTTDMMLANMMGGWGFWIRDGVVPMRQKSMEVTALDNHIFRLHDHFNTPATVIFTVAYTIHTQTTDNMSLPLGGGAMGAPPMPMAGGAEDQGVKAMKAAMESCVGKSVMSGVMGFGMGGLFGMFMASMSYDTVGTSLAGNQAHQAIANLPLRQQLKVGFKDMGTRSFSMAKNFGKVGALFSGIECGIEGMRAKNDLANGVAAGCLTGAILAKNAGPTAMAGGCAAFAAFSAAIDAYMRQPGDE
ncbi:import inner membrane translocase subunit tim-22 [Beauveria bassiana D1-5]|uniref:Mitochondrial import inner membrane translocase subunit TIM22 n=3 Tax=Beauveria TaxID=5581 RepID=A0A0A2VDL3_BEABA|nr:import inner membrane translocase subunit tim-22 [Beauveria bassiana D1-5]